MLQIPDRDEPFHHIDRNTLTRIAPPLPNPLVRTADAPATVADGPSLGIGSLKGGD